MRGVRILRRQSVKASTVSMKKPGTCSEETIGKRIITKKFRAVTYHVLPGGRRIPRRGFGALWAEIID